MASVTAITQYGHLYDRELNVLSTSIRLARCQKIWLQAHSNSGKGKFCCLTAWMIRTKSLPSVSIHHHTAGNRFSRYLYPSILMPKDGDKACEVQFG